jgi:hypothetical protein
MSKASRPWPRQQRRYFRGPGDDCHCPSIFDISDAQAWFLIVGLALIIGSTIFMVATGRIQ